MSGATRLPVAQLPDERGPLVTAEDQGWAVWVLGVADSYDVGQATSNLEAVALAAAVAALVPSSPAESDRLDAITLVPAVAALMPPGLAENGSINAVAVVA